VANQITAAAAVPLRTISRRVIKYIPHLSPNITPGGHLLKQAATPIGEYVIEGPDANPSSGRDNRMKRREFMAMVVIVNPMDHSCYVFRRAEIAMLAKYYGTLQCLSPGLQYQRRNELPYASCSFGSLNLP
jgi:hypothetical protein